MKINILLGLITSIILSSNKLHAKTLNIDFPNTVGNISVESTRYRSEQLKIKVTWECLYNTGIIIGATLSCGDHSIEANVDKFGKYKISGFKKTFHSPKADAGLYTYVTILTEDGKEFSTNIDRLDFLDNAKKIFSLLTQVKFYSLDEKIIKWKFIYPETVDSFFGRHDSVQVSLSITYKSNGSVSDHLIYAQYETIDSNNLELQNLPEMSFAYVCGNKCVNELIVSEEFTAENHKYDYSKVIYKKDYKMNMSKEWPQTWSLFNLNNDDSLEKYLEKINWNFISKGEIGSYVNSIRISVPLVAVYCEKGLLRGELQMLYNNSLFKTPMVGTCGKSFGFSKWIQPFNFLGNTGDEITAGIGNNGSIYQIQNNNKVVGYFWEN